MMQRPYIFLIAQLCAYPKVSYALSRTYYICISYSSLILPITGIIGNLA